MDRGELGQIITPASGNRLGAGRVWIGDNSVFGDRYPGDDAYHAWAGRFRSEARNCRFVVAPDVVCDAAATIERSTPHLAAIRTMGYPVALVAQNGLEDMTVPWDEFDVLFLGGDTPWKLGAAARALTVEANRRGKWVHMGRVNSRKRLIYAAEIGCSSVDGTYLAFGPDRNLPRLLGWLQDLKEIQGGWLW